MPDLVTLDQVKAGLRIDHDDDDAQLTLLISASSERIIRYLKSRAKEVLNIDDDGNLAGPVPPSVATATMMLVGYLYRDPDQDPERDWALGTLPKPVSSLIYQLRDPALA